MLKEFYIGCTDGENSHTLDVSPSTSLEQLMGLLAKIFAFADPKCIFLLASLWHSRLTEHSIVSYRQSKQPSLDTRRRAGIQKRYRSSSYTP